jgi:hypothetical protein
LLALLLDQHVEPIVMRVWTASWTLFSAGLVLIVFVGLYTVIDVQRASKMDNRVSGGGFELVAVVRPCDRLPLASHRILAKGVRGVDI